jgi:hypothetical protein
VIYYLAISSLLLGTSVLNQLSVLKAAHVSNTLECTRSSTVNRLNIKRLKNSYKYLEIFALHCVILASRLCFAQLQC